MNMNYANFLMVAVLGLLPSCVQSHKQDDNNQHIAVRNESMVTTADKAIKDTIIDNNVQSKQSAIVEHTEDQQVRKVLQQLNHDFAMYEKNNPQQGYCVTIQTDATGLQGKITPYGGVRTTQQLSGMPTDEASYKQQCVFCYYQHHKSDKNFIKDFADQTYAVQSLNHQVLVIPQEHYAHVFATPLEMQVIIVKHMLAVRRQYSENIKRPMEFHCGSAAGQTVFHLHGRTGVYV